MRRPVDDLVRPEASKRLARTASATASISPAKAREEEATQPPVRGVDAITAQAEQQEEGLSCIRPSCLFMQDATVAIGSLVISTTALAAVAVVRYSS